MPGSCCSSSAVAVMMLIRVEVPAAASGLSSRFSDDPDSSEEVVSANSPASRAPDVLSSEFPQSGDPSLFLPPLAGCCPCSGIEETIPLSDTSSMAGSLPGTAGSYLASISLICSSADRLYYCHSILITPYAIPHSYIL